jgi:holo-[acyl-carrier protein] synthase
VILGIGIDQVEIDRIASLLEREPERARERLFTAAERDTCEDRARPAQCYAARFAAKEAFLKALGTGLGRGISWQDVEVVVGDGGRPELLTRGKARLLLEEIGGRAVHLSFSHEAGLAVAAVVIEGRKRSTGEPRA